jgi:hypothetical protein
MKFKVLLAIVLLVCLPQFAAADTASAVVILGPGHATFPACAAGTCDGTADSTTGTYDVSKASFIRVQLYCSAGPCTQILSVQVRSKTNTAVATTPPWVPLATCTNVTTAGICSDSSVAYYTIPVSMSLRVVQSGTAAGTSQAILETHTVTP